MENKISSSIVGGIAGTAVITAMMLLANALGLQGIDFGKMLADFTHTTPIIGWIMHFLMGTLLAFAMVCVAVMILRYKKPELERPYRTPAVYLVGSLGVAFNIFLMCFVRKETWIAFLIWGAIGIAVYFLYSKRNSNLEKQGIE